MNSHFKMIDVGEKPVTQRRALARGQISLSAAVCSAIAEHRVPKGDVLQLAEIAGIGAAKKTSDILPLCHPLALNSVHVQCELDNRSSRVIVNCEVSAHARTGVEMEALSGVSGALLCIYDLTKGLDKAGTISEIALIEKEGGKSGHWIRAESGKTSQRINSLLQNMRAAVLTISDSCAAGRVQDESGEILASFLREEQAQIVEKAVLPDSLERIREKIEALALKDEVHLILASGGTGIGPRDLTPEALRPLWSKNFPGFGELFRSRGLLSTSHAWLSRAEAGLVGASLVVILPGSPRAVTDGVSILRSELPHVLAMLKGERH